MHAARTSYRLCSTLSDYKACHIFMRTESHHPLAAQDGIPPYTHFQVSFPSIAAHRDGKIVGVICSKMSPQYGLVAYPLHVAYDIKNHVPVVFRLIDSYDLLMRAMHITEYKVVMPSWKPSGRRIWEELHHADLVTTFTPSPGHTYHVYRVPVAES